LGLLSRTVAGESTVFAGAAERFRILLLRPGELLKKVRL
jgi:hypothetical protein